MSKEEKAILVSASALLSEIANSIDRAVSVGYCSYDDDEINGAVDIIEDNLDHVTTEHKHHDSNQGSHSTGLLSVLDVLRLNHHLTNNN